MYETLTYTGGVHKSEEVKELIEDLGGFILQENILQMELVLNLAIPLEDVDVIKNKAKELLAKVTVAPMAGSEIAIVSPTLQDITCLMQHVIFLSICVNLVLKTI